MERYRYALIGCGRISPNHLAAVFGNPDFYELVAICDLLPERMDSLLAGFVEGQTARIRRYESYKEMLSAGISLDVVAIATESGNHAQIALDCLQAGCHVIVEKPIALSLADANAMIHAAQENGRLLCACHQNRFNRSIRKIREAVETGRFGRMLHGTAHVRWNRDAGYYTQAPWRGTWEQDGGALMNQCIHNIDLLRWMLGDDIDEVFAYTANLTHPFIEAEDLGLALIRCKNGSYGIIEGTTSVYPRNLEETLYLFGETGTVKAGGKSVNLIEEWRFADNSDDPERIKQDFSENPPNVYGYGHIPLYRDVAEAIRDGRNPLVGGLEGYRALELVLAIYRSAKEGRPIKLPMDNFSTMDMKGRFTHE